jgi:hypothetical protein
MPEPADALAGFAYGEEWDALSQRSLGYRLLAPVPAAPWCAEVEALARRLQAAPYSDHWPAADLFCSVLLADGRRLVALTRYGLADHTPSHRRGGLEMVGVVGPAGLDVPSALAVYRWLRKRREATDDLHGLGGAFVPAAVLAEAPPAGPPPADPLPVLPVRLWQDAALLFAAATPSEPDHRLGLLEQGAGAAWQWLPLVGPDFPLAQYAQRGPLVAWTPHLAGVALRVDRKSHEVHATHPPRRNWAWAVLATLLGLTLVGLLVGNLWSTIILHRKLTAAEARAGEALPSPERPGPATGSGPPAQPGPAADSRDRFVAALRQLLADEGGSREWDAAQNRLLARYARLVRDRRDLRVAEDDTRGKVAVAAVSVLAGRSADRVEETVRKGLANKGFSDRVIKAACEHVREQLQSEMETEPAR